MKNSGISSARTPPLPFSAPTPEEGARDGFALTGPSVYLDPLTHAIRGDLADIRLADRVFAPHYAVAIRCLATRTAPLAATRGDRDAIATLAAGDAFELLELSGDVAWGIATAAGLVGYCDRTALGCVPET